MGPRFLCRVVVPSLASFSGERSSFRANALVAMEANSGIRNGSDCWVRLAVVSGSETREEPKR